MDALAYEWTADGERHELKMVRVPGTSGDPYMCFQGPHRQPIALRDFYIGATPVTQALWHHVMGENPSKHPGPKRPVENVSWDHLHARDGFLERINSGPVLAAMGAGDRRFRLPSETEWEYAARGGPRWRDDFQFSGSNNPDDVAWYGPRWSRLDQLGVQVCGWRIGWHVIARWRHRGGPPTQTHDVALKKPNQLGLYDMSGNVFEWCEDTCADAPPPSDGSPLVVPHTDRRLRGGSHMNWDLHCRVWWRYGIQSDAHDSCLGVRLALS